MESTNQTSATANTGSTISQIDAQDTLNLQSNKAANSAGSSVAMESEDETNVATMPTDEASALAGLTENVRDQDELERDITNQANQAMIEQEDERDQKRIEKVRSNIAKLEGQKRKVREQLDRSSNNTTQRARSLAEIDRIGADIAAFKNDIKDIESRIAERHLDDGDDDGDASNPNKRVANESQRDFLIRTGKITPFSRMPERGPDTFNGDLTEAIADAEEDAGPTEDPSRAEPRSHQNLRLPGFADFNKGVVENVEGEFGLRPRRSGDWQMGLHPGPEDLPMKTTLLQMLQTVAATI